MRALRFFRLSFPLLMAMMLLLQVAFPAALAEGDDLTDPFEQTDETSAIPAQEVLESGLTPTRSIALARPPSSNTKAMTGS